MDNNKNNNWLNVILNTEFQNKVQIKTLVEVSMVSKLAREKLKPAVFKSIKIHAMSIKFNLNVLSIAIEQQFKYPQFHFNHFNRAINRQEGSPEFDYKALKEKYKGIQESFNEYGVDLNDIKKFAKRFYLEQAKNAGYYLYPLINGFDNLTNLAILDCNIPFTAFAEIGKVLVNLNKLKLASVNLVKSSTDIIASSDISFPPNLTSLIIYSIQVATTDLLLDPYEYLFNSKSDNYSYEHFIMPKYPLYFLKCFKYYPFLRISNFNIEENLGLEEFLDANSKLESLDISSYNLKLNSRLNSLKFLHTDDKICFKAISNISNLDSINTLIFCLNKFEKTQNFRKFCMLCNNLVELHLYKNGLFADPQALIDEFLAPALPNLFKLKTLRLSYIHNNRFPKIFDFTKFTQIEELVLTDFGSISNIKFDNCKSLKRVEFYIDDEYSGEFMENLSNYEGWIFKYEDHKIFGNKF